jgi:hypothetical protein
MDLLEREEKVQALEGIGCQPVVIHATRSDLLEAVSSGLVRQELCFPELNGPVFWPSFRIADALNIV